MMNSGEDSPIFHDFLGLGPSEEIKQREFVNSDISRSSRKDTGFDEESEEGALTRSSSIQSGKLQACSISTNLAGSLVLAFPSPSDATAEHFSWGNASGHQHLGNKSSFYRPEADTGTGKKRDSTNKRDSVYANTEALETSHLIKVSRLEWKDERKGKHQATEVDDLHLPMQPPRPSCKGSMKLHSSIFKTDLAVPNPKKWYFSRQASLNMGRHGLTRGTCVDAHTEKVSGSSKENASLMPQMCPADEGSRTGLKGSSVVSLLNNGSSAPSATGIVSAGPTTGRSKLWSHNSVFSPQAIAMTSRQLTIFYGGQAHVFDDVPPDKPVELII
eukprot:c20447_g1_i1 orf=389-1378(+)